MLVLVDYDKFSEDVNKKLKELKIEKVLMFKINFDNKSQIKSDFDEILKIKDEIKPKFCAIQITIKKIDSSYTGFINTLKDNFDIVIGLGGLNKINRFFLESTNIDFLQDPHGDFFREKYDFIHHFNSGINHILANYANQKNIGFFFSLNFFYDSNKYKIPKIIGRVNQNLKLARKYNVNIYVNFVINSIYDIKSIVELRSIISIFDVSTLQNKMNFNILDKKVKKNKFQKSKKYIRDGIEEIRD